MRTGDGAALPFFSSNYEINFADSQLAEGFRLAQPSTAHYSLLHTFRLPWLGVNRRARLSLPVPGLFSTPELAAGAKWPESSVRVLFRIVQKSAFFYLWIRFFNLMVSGNGYFLL